MTLASVLEGSCGKEIPLLGGVAELAEQQRKLHQVEAATLLHRVRFHPHRWVQYSDSDNLEKVRKTFELANTCNRNGQRADGLDTMAGCLRFGGSSDGVRAMKVVRWKIPCV